MPGVTLQDSKSTIETDPIRNFKFQVNIAPPGIEDMIRLGFMSAAGLAANVDTIPYREGGNNTTTRKMPGQTNFGDITLTRGMVMGTNQMWRWFSEIFYVVQGSSPMQRGAGNNFRCNFYINVLDHPVTFGQTPIKARYNIYNGWPSTIAYTDLDAGGNGVIIEQLTIVHEGFTVEYAGPGAGVSLSEAPTF